MTRGFISITTMRVRFSQTYRWGRGTFGGICPINIKPTILPFDVEVALGRSVSAGRLTKLSHHLTAAEAVLRTTLVFGVLI